MDKMLPLLTGLTERSRERGGIRRGDAERRGSGDSRRETAVTSREQPASWSALEANADLVEVQEIIRGEIARGMIRVIPAPGGGIRIIPVAGQWPLRCLGYRAVNSRLSLRDLNPRGADHDARCPNARHPADDAPILDGPRGIRWGPLFSL